MTIPDDRWLDAIPLKGVGSEHLRDDAILPAHVAPGTFGLVGNITAIDPDDAASAGTSGLIADAAHQHAFTSGAASSLTRTSTNTEGSSSSHARADHGHSTAGISWGYLGRFSATGADSARDAGVDTDMTVTVAILANRNYKINLVGDVAPGAAGVVVAVELEHDGTVIGRFFRVGPSTNVAGNGPFQVNATVDYIPTADDASATFTVSNAAASGTSITMGPGPVRRTLTVSDDGPTT